jgi:hypothetical protein
MGLGVKNVGISQTPLGIEAPSREASPKRMLEYQSEDVKTKPNKQTNKYIPKYDFFYVQCCKNMPKVTNCPCLRYNYKGYIRYQNYF